MSHRMRITAVRLGVMLSLLAALSAPARAQLRWETFVHGGETNTVVAHGDGVWAGTSAGLRVYEPAPENVRVRELPLSEGLPGQAITAVAFERNAVWLGTGSGLVGRLDLDTNTWQTYDEKARFPAAPVTALLYDGQELWAGTQGGGLARFNVLRQDWQVWNTQDGLPDDNIRCLAADGDSVWAGTDQGLVRYTRETLSWEPVRVERALTGRITGLASSGRSLWVASTSDGLSRIRLDNGRYFRYDLGHYGIERVYALAMAPNGEVWAASDKGLLMAPKDGEGDWAFVEHPLSEVTGLTRTAAGIWVGTRRQGLWRYRTDNGEWTQYAPREMLPSGDLTAIAWQANNTWFGFKDDGLSRYELSTGHWEPLAPPAEVPRKVRDLAVFDNAVYCACADGIAVYDQHARTWRGLLSKLNPDLLGDCWTSVVATADHVWFAGPGRVSMFTPAMQLERTFQCPAAELNREETLPKLVLDNTSGDVWLITRTSAWRYLARQGLWSEFGADLFEPTTAGLFQRAGRLIRELTFDHESAWFVTLDRVVQYLKPTNQLWNWDEGREQGLREPRRVAADRFGAWVASDVGLNQFDRQQGRWRTYPWDPTGPSGEPTALAVDAEEPFIWVATERGVCRLELTTEGARWRIFPASTGIVPGVKRILTTPYGVWFVGRDGVTLYHRERPAEEG